MTDELNQLDIAILVSICKATNVSKSAHVPIQYFIKKFQNKMKMAKRSLHKLISLGYVSRHPTGGEMTYELTQKGLVACMEIKEQLLRDLG